MSTESDSHSSSETPVIPDHEVIKQIGAGSYGEVWLGRSVTGLYRAIKIVRRERFTDNRPYEREFNGIQKFEPVSRTHDSQVDILHVGRSDGFFYYVMELADDAFTEREIDPEHYAPRTLAGEMLQHGRLSAKQCVEIARSLTTALHHLHENGLVHRDVKPSNIIFVNGRAKLADIGLVSSADATMSVVGTEGFIPPEGPGSPQGDLYSLGKVLYEAATGMDRMEFPALPKNVREFEEHELFLELNAVVAKACRRDAKERYQSAQAMQADLILLQEGRSIRKSQRLERQLKKAKRAAVFLVFLSLLGTSAWIYQSFQTHKVITLVTERDEMLEENQALLAEQQLNLGRAYAEKGLQFANQGELQNAIYWTTEALKRIPIGSKLHSNLDRRVGSYLGQIPVLAALFPCEGDAKKGIFFDDGKGIVLIENNRELAIWDTETLKRRISPITMSEDIRSIESVNHGKKILVRMAGQSPLVLVDTKTGHSSQINMGGDEAVEFTLVSPDSSHILIDGKSSVARLWRLGDPPEKVCDLPELLSVSHAAFSDDGRWLAAASDRMVFIWKLGEEVSLVSALRHDYFIIGVQYSGDSSHLITTSRDISNAPIGDVTLWKLTNDDAEQVHTIRHKDYSPALINAVMAPDPFSEIITMSDKGAYGWNTEDGKQSYFTEFNGARLDNPVLSPDQEHLALFGESRDVQILDIHARCEQVTRIQHPMNLQDCLFSPDGSALLTTCEDGIARLWKLPEHQNRRVPKLGALPDMNEIFHVAYSPDNSKLLICDRFHSTIVDASTLTPVIEPVFLSGGGYGTFTPDGTLAALCAHPELGGSPTVVVIDSSSGKEVTRFSHTKAVTTLQFSSDGAYLITGSLDGTVEIRDSRRTFELTSSVSQDQAVKFVTTSPDANWVGTVDEKNNFLFWPVQDREPSPISIDWKTEITAICFDPNNDEFLLADAENKISRVPVSAPEMVNILAEFSQTIRWLQKLKSGDLLVCSMKGEVNVVKAGQQNVLIEESLELGGEPVCIAVEEKRDLIVVGRLNGTIQSYSLETGAQTSGILRPRYVYRKKFNRDAKWRRRPYALSISKDRNELAVAAADGGVVLWDLSATSLKMSDLQRIAELSSPNTHGNIGNLSSSAYENLNKLLSAERKKAETAHRFHYSALPKWHESQLHVAWKRGAYDTIVFHGNALAKTRPMSFAEVEAVTDAYGESGMMSKVEQTLLRYQSKNEFPRSLQFKLALAKWMGPEPNRFSAITNLNIGGSVDDALKELDFAYAAGFSISDGDDVGIDQHEDPRVDARKMFLKGNFSEGVDFLAETASRNRGSYSLQSLYYLGIAALESERLMEAIVIQDQIQKISSEHLAEYDWERKAINSLFWAMFQDKLKMVGIDVDKHYSVRELIPPRHEDVSPKCVDLTDYYNASLFENWHSRNYCSFISNLSGLFDDPPEFGDLEFDIRGIVQLDSLGLAKNLAEMKIRYGADTGKFPRSVRGIEVGRFAKRLHFLHAFGWDVKTGEEVGEIVVRYKGGLETKIPLVYGTNIAGSWCTEEVGAKLSDNCTLAWSGENLFARTIAQSDLCIYLYSWKNPNPEIEIESIDYVSFMKNAAPFLIALTAE